MVNVLSTVRDVIGSIGRIITVVGAGGNRDKGKRPIMAREAALRSDLVILTSDNPRDEEPEAIAARIGDGGGGMLKNMLTESLNEKLRPLREERKRLETSPDYIRQVLLTGSEKAREMAVETLNEVRHVMNMEI